MLETNFDRPHTEIDHSTPDRVMLRATTAGTHEVDGQVLPVNDIAKAGITHDGTTWSIPADAEFYAHEAAAEVMVAAGAAERMSEEAVQKLRDEAEALKRRATEAEDRQRLAELQAKYGK